LGKKVETDEMKNAEFEEKVKDLPLETSLEGSCEWPEHAG
jgi:hypothetical protein